MFRILWMTIFVLATSYSPATSSLEEVIVSSDNNDDKIYLKDDALCSKGVFIVTVDNKLDDDIGVQVQESGKLGALLETTAVEGLELLLITFPGANFGGDTSLQFNISKDDFAINSITRLVVFPEILSGFQIDVPDGTVAVGTTVLISASVNFGDGVSFIFHVASPTSDIYHVYKACNSTSKTAQMQFAVTKAESYNVSVFAISSFDEILKKPPQYFNAQIPLPNMTISTMEPATLRTESNEMTVACGENVKIIFRSNTMVKEAISDVMLQCQAIWDGLVKEYSPQDSYLTIISTHVWNKSSVYAVNISCKNKISERYETATITVKSPVEYVSVDLVEEVALIDVNSGYAVGNVSYEMSYEGQFWSTISAYVDFGVGDKQYISQILEKHLFHTEEYTNRGLYDINITVKDDSITYQKLMKLRVGIINLIINPQSAGVVSEGEEISFIIEKFINQSLTLDVTVDTFFTEKTIMSEFERRRTVIKKIDIPGEYTASLTTSHLGKYEKVIAEFNVTEKEFHKNLTTDNLFEKKYRNPKTPLPATLSHIPTISARSPLGDKTSNSLGFLWKLSKNIDPSPLFSWEELEIKQPHAINLVVENFVYESGLYKIDLTINITNFNTLVKDYMHIEVRKEPIIAVIKGGIMRQVGVGHFIRLDGTLSYDSASDSVTGERGMDFSWACFDLKGTADINKFTTPFSQDTSYRNHKKCNILEIPNAAVATVNSAPFSLNSWLLVELIVRKDAREAYTTQVVSIVEQQPPNVQIICQWNCEPKLLTKDRTVLRVDIDCPSCTTAQIVNIQYKWSLYEVDLTTGDQTLIPASKWPDDIVSEEASPVFDCHGGWWKEATGYKIKAEVQIASLPMSTAEMNLYTNLPPYGGSCSVTPTTGIAGETGFSFSVIDWKDEGSRPNRDSVLDLNPVLSYTFQQVASIKTPFVYSGGEISTPLKKLVACGTTTGECDIIAQIIDAYKGVAVCMIKVKVTDMVELRDEKVSGQLLGKASAVISYLEQQMNDTIYLQDPVKIAQDAATFGTILGSMGQSVETEEQFTDINVEDLDSEDGLLGLVDVGTTVMPIKNRLEEASNKFILDTSGALEEAVRRNDVRTPSQVQMFTKSLTSSVQSSTNFISGSSVKVASESAKNLSLILSDQSAFAKVNYDIHSALSSMSDLMDSIVHVMDINAASLEPDPRQLGNDTGLGNLEINYAADLLAKRRRFNVKSKMNEAPTIVEEARKTWDNMFRVTKDLQNPEGQYTISKDNYKMFLKKAHRKQILKETEKIGHSDPDISFSMRDVEVENEYEDLHFQVVKTKNIFSYGAKSKYITSDVIIASVETKRKSKVNMKSPVINYNTEDDCRTKENLEIVRPRFIEEDAARMFYHKFEYSDPSGVVCVKIRPTHNALFYRLYAKIGREPNDISYDYRATVPANLMEVCQEMCVPRGKLKGTGTAYIGLRPFIDETKNTGRTKRSASVIDPLASPYMYGMTVTACYTWNDKQVDWIASQCVMRRNGSHVTCKCNSGPELIGAISFQFAPNQIHFGTVFTKFDIENQAAVLGVLLGLYFLFGLLAVWAHYMDRKSVFRWGIFPLKDNYAEDEYFYLITVHTGLRKGAGTTSNIGFALSGDKGETGVRKLTDGVRHGMPTGSVIHFVMAVPATLGSLQYLRIWHDSSGPGSKGAWYLNKVLVTDLQNGDSFLFPNTGWLCPERQTLDRVIHASSPEEIKSFQVSFLTTASRQITDDHMWVSVFVRPERSRFSRLERVGCCLSFLLLSMITSAMFYRGAEDIDREQSKPDVLIGPLRLSWQQLYFSLVAAVITSVPLFFIITIFRRARLNVEEKVAANTCGCRRQKDQDTTKKMEKKTPVNQSEEINAEIIYLDEVEMQKDTVKKEKKKVFHNSSYRSLSEDSLDDETRTNVTEVTENDDFGKGEAEEIVHSESQKEAGREDEQIQTSALNFGTTDRNISSDLKSDIITKSRLTLCCAKMPWMKRLEREIQELDKILLIRPMGHESLNGSWPYVTCYVAWVLVFASVLVCSFFVTLYSMEWGKDISEEWLSTFFLSFLQSLIVVDPTKVVFISILIAIFIRKVEFVGLHEINMAVVLDVNKIYGIQKKSCPPRKHISYHSALTPDELQEAALKRKVSVLVRKTLLELAEHGVLLLLVCSMCYTNRTTSDYRLQETVYNSLIAPKYTGFKYVNSTRMYFDWLENVVTPWLFPEKNYKGESILSQDRLFTSDWSFYRLGAPRLRQVRMPFDDCPSYKIKNLPCVNPYSFNGEEVTEYCFAWKLPLPCPSIDQLRMTATAWHFQSAFKIWGTPISGHFTTYGGGGYLMNLDINAIVVKAILKEARNNFWIDRQTSAVFLEFTLFNPNTDHFLNVVLLAEFIPLGGVITYFSVYPFTPYRPRGALGQYISCCEIACILFTGMGFFYVVNEFRQHRKAAFRNFWFMIDFLVLMLATIAISMFFLRLSALKTALKTMRKDPTQYVNFKQVVTWDIGFLSSMGFLIALVSFRLLKLAGYSKKTMRVYEALRLSVGILPSFLLAIWLVIASFAFAGMILFSATSIYYKSYLDSVFVLFLGILGKSGFKDTGLPPSGFYITVIYFVLFTCIVNIFLAQWFIAVLLDILTVGAQRDCPAVRSDNAKVFQLLWESFVYLFWKKNPPIETLRKNHIRNTKKTDQIMEEFDEWLQRLNLSQRLEKSTFKSSVAIYDEMHALKEEHDKKKKKQKGVHIEESRSRADSSNSNSRDGLDLCSKVRDKNTKTDNKTRRSSQDQQQ